MNGHPLACGKLILQAGEPVIFMLSHNSSGDNKQISLFTSLSKG
jgi:hypothetical protein